MQLRAAGVQFEREHKFHPTRRWRFDFALPEHRIGVEVEGGTWNGGRHTRGSGYEKDCEKYAEALCLGWRVLRVTGKQVKSGDAALWLFRILGLSLGDSTTETGAQ